MEPGKLQEHVLSTYLTLRYGAGIITLCFPILVWFFGQMGGVGLQSSISAYYWADGFAAAPVRVWFVGVLFALASFFYLYKGFTARENIAFNLAGLSAIGVAYFPMPWGCETECPKFTVHGVCAVLVFVCLVYVVWFCSADTLAELNDPALEKKYKRRYRGISIVMAASPIAAFVLNTFVGKPGAFVFFAEACGIWAFAYYWWVKNDELRKSSALQKALRIGEP
jgi:hypothetical protein